MLKRTKSFSTSCISMENLVMSTLVSSRIRSPVHRRPASNSDTLMRKPYFINLCIGDNFSIEGDLGLCNSRDDHNNDHSYISVEMSDQKFSYSSDNNNTSFDSELRIMAPDNNSPHTTETQNRVPNYDHCTDPKRIKRLLANRVSAQRSRLRKLEYVGKLKREIDNEEARLCMLYPQISDYETQCKLLEMKNYEMKEKVEALENEKAAKEAEFQALMEESYARSSLSTAARMEVMTYFELLKSKSLFKNLKRKLKSLLVSFCIMKLSKCMDHD